MSKGHSNEANQRKSRLNPYSRRLPDNALRYVLEALVPYTQANMKLAFKPSEFFNDLDRIDKARYSRSTVRSAYYRAQKQGLIRQEGTSLTLTDEGKRSLKPYQPEKLVNSHILVVFDIPEAERYKRRMFRILLRELKFRMVQQSVWVTDYECRDILTAEIKTLKIQKFVQVFEAVELSPQG